MILGLEAFLIGLPIFVLPILFCYWMGWLPPTRPY